MGPGGHGCLGHGGGSLEDQKNSTTVARARRLAGLVKKRELVRGALSVEAIAPVEEKNSAKGRVIRRWPDGEKTKPQVCGPWDSFGDLGILRFELV